MTHEIPYIPKESITIVVVGDSTEGNALRAVLEGMNYKVALHHASSRKELLEILKGNVAADDKLILSCHATEKGIEVPDESPLGPTELAEIAHLPGKLFIINLGCNTGSNEFREAFQKAGVSHYIAPNGYPEGSAAIVFTTNLFYNLTKKLPLTDAMTQARLLDDETKLFELTSF